MNLLLCSSSGYKETEYLSHTRPFVQEFFAGLTKTITSAIFVPYAGVTRSYDDYLQRVTPYFSALGITLTGLHEVDDPQQALQETDMIIVGGGNTFALLRRLQLQGVMQTIREQVSLGKPYMGWSAGANLAGLTIATTNDMPIVQPDNFSALALVPFLINPHFISGQIAGHNGESREQRLAEFMVLNPKERVVALTEGSALMCHGIHSTLIGYEGGFCFQGGEQTPLPLGPCDFLLAK